MSAGTGLLEIGEVARELGVPPSTLRTWERRYRLVVPRRGPSGQRLYDAQQITVLRSVLAQIRGGRRARTAHSLADALHIELPAGRQAPAEARRAVDAFLPDDLDRRFAFFVRLVVSELVSNAVLHAGGGPIELTLERTGNGTRAAVRDRGGRLEITRLRRRAAGRKHGLDIVDALASEWSIAAGPLGTTVTVQMLSDDVSRNPLAGM